MCSIQGQSAVEKWVNLEEVHIETYDGSSHLKSVKKSKKGWAARWIRLTHQSNCCFCNWHSPPELGVFAAHTLKSGERKKLPVANLSSTSDEWSSTRTLCRMFTFPILQIEDDRYLQLSTQATQKHTTLESYLPHIIFSLLSPFTCTSFFPFPISFTFKYFLKHLLSQRHCCYQSISFASCQRYTHCHMFPSQSPSLVTLLSYP